ncbi:MAG: DUF2752 domain-containing protein [Planctomycetales bacterium]|nr:DUF2752 domain-containing protein [Planctomycetales bacterium]
MRSTSATNMAVMLVTVVLVAATLSMLYAVNPDGSAWYPKCPLHELTGLNCPGCGGLRGVHQLLRGNVMAAFRLNALAFLLLPPLALTWLVNQYRQWRHRQRGGEVPQSLFPSWTGWVLLIVVVAFAIARNIPWGPFLYLAPG